MNSLTQLFTGRGRPGSIRMHRRGKLETAFPQAASINAVVLQGSPLTIVNII